MINEDDFKALFENSSSVMLLIDLESGSIENANLAAAHFYGYGLDTLLAMNIKDINILSEVETSAALKAAAEKKENHFRFRHKLCSGDIRDVDVYSGPVEIAGRKKLFSVIHDITDTVQAELSIRRNTEILQALIDLEIRSAELNELELVGEGIETAERILACGISYLHLFDPETQTIQLTNWSKATLTNCTATKDIHYPLAKAGIWADCARIKAPVIHNNRKEIEQLKGFPEGHISVRNHLSVCVLIDDQVRLILGVGNKVTDFDDSDAQHLQVIANTIWRLIEQKRYETRLRESEVRFRRLLEFAPDCVFVLGSDSNIFFVNETACNTFGYSKEELTGNSIEKIVPERFRAFHPELCASFIEKGTQRAMGGGLDLLAVCKDGSEIAVEISLSPIDQEGTRIVLVIVRDVTDRRKAQQTLMVSQQRSSLAIEATKSAVFDWDLITDSLYLSQTYFEIIGIERLDANKRSYQLDELSQLTHDQSISKQFIALQKQEQTESMRDHHLDLSGGLHKWVRLTAKIAERDANGDPTRIVGTIQDVDDAYKLQQQFMQSQKMEAVGRLAGGIAHDFNNLLTAILGNADLLLMDLPPSGSQYEEVLTIRDTANRATQLTSQLLALSKKHVQKIETVNVNETIDNARKMYERILGEDLELKIAVAPHMLLIEANPGTFDQCILNLVVNARDALPNGGSLTISTELIEFDEVSVLTKPGLRPGKYVSIGISDSGVGMIREVQAHIFEPYYTTKENGTGLGLATVYGAIEQMRGAIYVYSELGKGTTFNIYLPCTENMKQQASQPSLVNEVPRGTGKIYVIDDEPSVVALVETILTGAGYTVEKFLSAEEAKKAFEKDSDRPICIVTDVVLPGMGGVELADQMHALDQSLKIVFMSGYTEERTIGSNLEEASHAFLPKPFTPYQLAIAVKKVLQND